MKFLFIIFIAVSVATLMSGCLFSESTNVTNNNSVNMHSLNNDFNSEATLKLGAEPVDVSNAKWTRDAMPFTDTTIARMATEHQCKPKGEFLADTSWWEEMYLVQNDSLYLWSVGDCYARVWLGSGSTLENTIWESHGITDIPNAAHRKGCEPVKSDVGPSYEWISLIPNFQISNGIRSDFYSGQLCFADDFYSNNNSSTSLIEVIDCQTIQVSSQEDQVITVRFEYLDLSSAGYSSTYTYQGNSCNYQNILLSLPSTEQDCLDAWDNFTSEASKNDVTFAIGNGFFDYFNYQEENYSSRKSFESCLAEHNFPESTMDFITLFEF